jgi:RNA polymerase sigma-70 factor (ECF subfamily)
MIDQRTERFEAQRGRLVRHAYRMLGEFSEAEDVVQDAFLRWNDALERTAVDDDAAFLRATVTRLCIDRLRSARARREVYVGPWLPEFVVDERADDPEAAAAFADDVSFALLLALDRLSPLERAAFLLHDVLDVPFAEVAQTIGRAEPAVRQLAARAREHVREARTRPRTSREEALRLRDAFLAAIRNDDPAALQALLTRDVVFLSDGGGKATAATVPIVGQDNVGKLLAGLARKGAGLVRRVELAILNGLPGFVLFDDKGVVQVLALDVVDGKVGAIYTIRNPDKLPGIKERFSP